MPCSASRRTLSLRNTGLVACLMLLAAGCQQQQQQIEQAERPREVVSHQPPETEHKAIPIVLKESRFEIGRSVEGRPIECVALGEGPEVVFIMASIHGNEPAGTPLVNRLVEYIKAHDDIALGRRIVIMPIANPDGYAKGSRHNVNDVDLNRNFPAANFQTTQKNGKRALSQPESRAIDRILREHKPTRIVSLHQPINYGKACIDYDGPGKTLAACMARHSDLDILKLGARPGSLGSYAGETLGIPIITIELPKDATHWNAEQLWKRYGRMMLAAIAHPNEREILAGME